MKRADPATQRKALEFAHEMAKHGVSFIVIPVFDDTKDTLASMLGAALARFAKEYADANDSQATNLEIGRGGAKV